MKKILILFGIFTLKFSLLVLVFYSKKKNKLILNLNEELI
jgi:hypothetical protein